jgi:hypothetical protein
MIFPLFSLKIGKWKKQQNNNTMIFPLFSLKIGKSAHNEFVHFNSHSPFREPYARANWDKDYEHAYQRVEQ